MKFPSLVGVAFFACVASVAFAADLPDLSAYAGKYPFDAVGGHPFFENPKVAATLDAAVGHDIAEWVGDLEVGSPIELQDDGLIASVCETNNCPGNNAALAISTAGELIALCLYSLTGEIGTIPGKAHWIGPRLEKDLDPLREGGGCPRDGEEFLEAYTQAIR